MWLQPSWRTSDTARAPCITPVYTLSRLIRPSACPALVPSNPSIRPTLSRDTPPVCRRCCRARRDTLIQAVDTCLSSKVVSQNCETISPMAVDAVMGIIDPLTATNVDLRDIKARKEAFLRIVVYLYYCS